MPSSDGVRGRLHHDGGRRRHIPRPTVLAITASYFAAFAGLGLVVAAPGACLLAMVHQTSSSLDEIGAIFTVRALGYLAGTVATGALLERLRGRGNLLLAGAVAATAACTLLVPGARRVASLAALVASQGFAMGCLDTGGNVQLIMPVMIPQTKMFVD